MTSFAILLILIGIFVIINASSFKDVVFGNAKISFINPKSAA